MNECSSSYEETKHDPELNMPLPGWLVFWYNQYMIGSISDIEFGREVFKVIKARTDYDNALGVCIDQEEYLSTCAKRLLEAAETFRKALHPK